MKRYFVAALLVLAACASQPEEIGTTYVSPVHYKNFDCEQLEMEAERVSRRALELHANLEELADTDAAQMGVGLILFWPALFFLEGGDGAEAMEYARIKGERNAIEERSIEQKCGIEFQKTAAATSGIDQRAGLAAPPAAASEPPIPLAMAQPSVAATSPSSRIALPPAEYKPLPVGTKVTYDTWGYTVTKTEGFDITFKTTAGNWKHYYAVFGKQGDNVYLSGEHAQWGAAGQDWESDLDAESKAALENIWPLKVGKKVKLNSEESTAGYAGFPNARPWTVALEVVRTEVLELNGVLYSTYVIEEHAVSGGTTAAYSPAGPEGYSETKWYNPESGLVLKSVKEMTLGPKKGEQEEYSLVRVRLP